MNIIDENEDSIIDDKINKISWRKIVMIIVLLLFNFILFVNIGYAASNEMIKVNGTSNVDGKFQMFFDDAKIEKIVGVEENTSSIFISEDKKALVFNAGNLQYPGAVVTYSASIVNKSLVPVIINSIECAESKEGSVIKVTGLEKLKDNFKILNSGEKYNFTFNVLWDKECEFVVNANAKFLITINFSQNI